jgi:Sugar phosphate permease
VAKIAGNLGKEVSDPAVLTAAGHVGAWQWCFWIPAFIGVLGIILIVATLRDTPSSVGLPELPDTKTELDEDESKEAFRKFIREKVLKNKIVWILAVTDIFVYIVRFAVLDWGPKFLQMGENHLSPMWAGATIGIFELFGCLGMLSAGWITDHLFGSKAQRVCAIEMALTALCLVVLHLLPAGTSPVLMLFLLAFAGFFLYGPQALLGVTASNQVTKKGASSAVGIIGLMSYLSVLFTGIGIGVLSDKFGDSFWNNLYLIMAGIAIVGGLVVATLWNIKDDGYIHEES